MARTPDEYKRKGGQQVREDVERQDAEVVGAERSAITERLENDVGSVSEWGDEGRSSWYWTVRPIAVEADGKTFFSYVDMDGGIVAEAVDNETLQSVQKFELANHENDDHNNASICVLPDGRILCAYTRHSADDVCRVRISDNAYDISSFGAETQLAGDSGSEITYTNTWYLEDEGRIYIFSRQNDNSSGSDGWVYWYSDDGGTSWSSYNRLIDTDGWNLYIHSDSDGGSRIGMTVNHRRDVDSTPSEEDIMFCYFEGGSIYAADGSLIGSTPVSINDLPVLYSTDANDRCAWGYDTKLRGGGDVELVFATYNRDLPSFLSESDSFDIEEYVGFDDHDYHYGYYDAAADDWTVTKITDAGGPMQPIRRDGQGYTGGINLSDTDPGVCYLSVGNYRQSKVQRWETDDHGETWRYTDISDAHEQNIRPQCPINADEDLPVLWLKGRHWQYRQYFLSVVGPKHSADNPSTEKMRESFVGILDSDSAPASGGKIPFDLYRTNTHRGYSPARNEVEIQDRGIYLLSGTVVLNEVSESGEITVGFNVGPDKTVSVASGDAPTIEVPMLQDRLETPDKANIEISSTLSETLSLASDRTGCRMSITRLL